MREAVAASKKKSDDAAQTIQKLESDLTEARKQTEAANAEISR